MKDRTKSVRDFFQAQLDHHGRKGLIGFARFSKVFECLMPVQQEVLRTTCGSLFDTLMQEGTIVSIAIPYEEPFISSINQMSDRAVSYDAWNRYAAEYGELNRTLNSISAKIAEEFAGIALPATWATETGATLEHVRDYFGRAVSHRVIAELAGLGWRGKNGLVINERYSCAIRFASIVLLGSLEYSKRVTQNCGECTACEDACSFIRNRGVLPDYRDNCRRYIDHLRSKGLIHDVCGRCIKACYFESIYSDKFYLDISK